MSRSEDAELDVRAMQAALGAADPDLPPVAAGRTDELLQAEAYWNTRLAPLLDAAAPVAPSAGLWRRIAADTGQVPGVAGSAADPPPRSRPGRAAVPGRRTDRGLARLWTFLGLGPLSAYAAGVASVIVVALAGAPRPALIAVLQSPDGARAGFSLVIAPDRTIRLRPLAGASVPPDRALQFWTKADTDPGPTSLGLLAPDAPAVIPFPGALPSPGQLFEVTLEPATGSPIGRPTGPVLFIGRAIPGRAV